MKVEVFVKKDEIILQPTQLGRPVAGHYCTAHDTFKTEEILPEASKRVLDEAVERAKQLNAELVIYNLSTWKGKLAAKRRGVKSPTWRIAK
jgi:hypothetical protein